MIESKSSPLPRLIGLALALSLTACQPGTGNGEQAGKTETAGTTATPSMTQGAHAITGTATYLERIMMPPGSSLRVQLLDNLLADTPKAVLSEVTLMDLAGPPFAFSLPYDPVKLRPGGQYGLHASLSDADGKLWFVTDTRVPVDPASNTPVEMRLVRVAAAGPEAAGGATTAAAASKPSYWQCGEVRVSADFSDKERTTLSFNGRNLVLPLAMSGSGARYADGKGNEFWTKGDSGTLSLTGEERRECNTADGPSPWEAARARDIGFRAVGNEPGWWVEVGMGEAPPLRAELDFGARKLDIAQAQPLTGALGFSGKTANGTQVELKIERKPCQDNMSGSSFEASAQLTAGGKTYTGCGAFLRD